MCTCLALDHKSASIISPVAHLFGKLDNHGIHIRSVQDGTYPELHQLDPTLGKNLYPKATNFARRTVDPPALLRSQSQTCYGEICMCHGKKIGEIQILGTTDDRLSFYTMMRGLYSQKMCDY